MIDLFAPLLVCISAVFIVWTLWCFYQNKRTYDDRSALINAIYTPLGHDILAASKQFHAVSYNQHFWDRVFLRNPWRRYPPDLVALLNQDTEREKAG